MGTNKQFNIRASCFQSKWLIKNKTSVLNYIEITDSECNILAEKVKENKNTILVIF